MAWRLRCLRWLGMPLVQAWGLSIIFVIHATTMIVVAGLCAMLMWSHTAKNLPIDNLQIQTMTAKIIQAYRSAPILAPGIGWLFYTLTFVSLLAIIPERLPDELRNWISAIMPLTGIVASIIIVRIAAALDESNLGGHVGVWRRVGCGNNFIWDAACVF